MVSKVALRSRRIGMLRFPVSEERRGSLVILRRAISVLWYNWNPDVPDTMLHTCYWQRGGLSVERLQHVWSEVIWGVRVDSRFF